MYVEKVPKAGPSTGNERKPKKQSRGFPILDFIADVISTYARRYGKVMWWLHSAYALTLGGFVVVYASKGFENARMLAVSVVLAWSVVLLFFRVFGSGAQQQDIHGEAVSAKTKVKFFVMTYVLKNLYQGMLFFLLPFYFKSSSSGTPNFWYVVVLATFALLSTMDLIFDRVVLRRRLFASMFHAIVLFSCLNLLIPAIFFNTRTLYAVMSAGGITVVAFWSLNAPLAMFRQPRFIAAFLGSIAAGVGIAYVSRSVIPPVPMVLSYGAVGPCQLRADGRLTMEVKQLHWSQLDRLFAVTDVMVPGGQGDELHHVWLHEGMEYEGRPDTSSLKPTELKVDLGSPKPTKIEKPEAPKKPAKSATKTISKDLSLEVTRDDLKEKGADKSLPGKTDKPDKLDKGADKSAEPVDRCAIDNNAELTLAKGIVQLRSSIAAFDHVREANFNPKKVVGEWTVLVRTADDQTVGRTTFKVVE